MTIDELIKRYNAELPTVDEIMYKSRAVGLGSPTKEEALKRQKGMILKKQVSPPMRCDNLIEELILTTNISETGGGSLHFFSSFEELSGKKTFCTLAGVYDVFLDESGKIYAIDWELGELTCVCPSDKIFIKVLGDYMIKNKNFIYKNIPVVSWDIQNLEKILEDEECFEFFHRLYRELMQKW